MSASTVAQTAPTTCIIYHDKCWDGMTAAYIASRHVVADCLPWKYGNRYISTRKGATYDTVYVLDISFGSGLLEQLNRLEFSRCIWIDHHLGDPIKDERITWIIDTTCSATVATWRYFNQSAGATAERLGSAPAIPYYVELVNNHDMFYMADRADEYTRAYLTVQDPMLSFSAIADRFNMQRDDPVHKAAIRAMFASNGYAMLSNMAKSVVDSDNVEYVNWHSRHGVYLIVVVNAVDVTGLVLRYQLAKYSRFTRMNRSVPLDFVVRVRRGKQWSLVSLRAANPTVNAHEIAAKYGGGGHMGAASFRCLTKDLDSGL